MAVSKMTNVGLVLLQQTIVVVVSLRVAADVNLRFHAPPDQLLNRVNHDEVDDEDAGDRRGWSDAVREAFDAHGGIAIDPAIVDHQVRDVRQAFSGRVSRGPAPGLIHIGNGHGLQTAGLGFQHHFYWNRITPSVGGHDQQITGGDGVLIEYGLGSPLLPLQIGRLGGVEVHHQGFLQNRNSPGQMAGAVKDLFRDHVGMTRAKGVQKPLGSERVRQPVTGGRDGGPLSIGDPVELVTGDGDELIVSGHLLLLNAFGRGGAIQNSNQLG